MPVQNNFFVCVFSNCWLVLRCAHQCERGSGQRLERQNPMCASFSNIGLMDVLGKHMG